MRRLTSLVALAVAGGLVLTGCSSNSTPAAETKTVTMWSHAAGNEQEIKTVEEAIADFNKAQTDYKVVLEKFPQESYNDSIIAAATSNTLPCIVDVDGPIMPNWAWAGYMQPITIDSTLEANLLPGAKGYYNGQLYSAGAWDAALGILTRKSYLDEIGRAHV